MNPYESPTQASIVPLAQPNGRSWQRFAIIGGIVGVVAPFCFAVWLVCSVWAQAALPGTAKCGMPVLGGLLIIALVCPVGGILFATIGAAVGGIRDMIVCRRVSRNAARQILDSDPRT